jgi:hypothetical protein
VRILRSLAPWLVCLGVAAAPALAGAATAAEVESDLEAALEQVGEAGSQLVEAGLGGGVPDLAQAVQNLDDALALQAGLAADLADPSTQAALGDALSGVGKGVGALGKGLVKARAGAAALEATGDSSAKSITKLGKALAKTKASGERALAELQAPAQQPFLLVERGKTGGFLTPWQALSLELVPNPFAQPPCTEAATLQVTNPGTGGTVFVEESNLMPRPGEPFVMFAGSDGGGARIAVTACGVTRERIVHNYGAITNGPLTSGFDGAWAGTFTGSASGVVVETGEPFQTAVAGDVAATVSNGLVAISAPGAGTGRVWEGGAIKGGGAADLGIPVFFVIRGSFKGDRAAGSWQAPIRDPDLVGAASGSWSVSRQ